MNRRDLALLFSVAILVAQTVPDLSGEWRLDPARSTATGTGPGRGRGAGQGTGGGLSLGPSPDALTIRQDATSLTIQDVRYLDRDGSLVVDTTIPGRSTTRKAVYLRSATP